MKNREATNAGAIRFCFSIRSKMLVAFVGVALVPMVLLGIFVTGLAERLLADRIAQELSPEVTAAADMIEEYLSGVRRDVHSLSRFLEQRLKMRMTEAEWRGVENEFLRTMEAERAYYQVRFIDVDGMEGTTHETEFYVR